MMCGLHPSERLMSIRNRLKERCHGGGYFTADDVIGLVRELNTAVALTIELEDENRVLGHAVKSRTPDRRPATTADIVTIASRPGSKIVMLPVRRPAPHDGGDAA